MNPSPAHPQSSPPVRWLGETDVWLLAQGKHLRPWQKLGAHPTVLQGEPFRRVGDQGYGSGSTYDNGQNNV